MGGAIQRRFDGHPRRFRRLGSKMRWIFLSGITLGDAVIAWPGVSLYLSTAPELLP